LGGRKGIQPVKKLSNELLVVVVLYVHVAVAVLLSHALCICTEVIYLMQYRKIRMLSEERS